MTRLKSIRLAVALAGIAIAGPGHAAPLTLERTNHWLVIRGPALPGEIRGKIYLVPNDVPALLKRYARDFPEHQPRKP